MIKAGILDKIEDLSEFGEKRYDSCRIEDDSYHDLAFYLFTFSLRIGRDECNMLRRYSTVHVRVPRVL